MRSLTTREGVTSIDDPSRWGIDAYLQIFAVIAVVAVLHVPLGNYLARVYTDSKNWRIEKVIYRLIGAQPDDVQR